MNPERRAALLASTPLFGGMAGHDLTTLAAATGSRRYRRGQLIVRQGEPGHSLFVVADGLVKVVVTSFDGEELILATLNPGETFGELAVIDGGYASASVEAVVDTRVLALSRTTLLDLVARRPGLAEVLLRSLGRLIRRLTDQAADLVFLDLKGRIAKLLVAHLAPSDAPSPDHDELTLPLTQSEIGAMVGGSRQSVNQTLQSFEHRGWVERRGRRLVIKDLEALRHRSGLPTTSTLRMP